MRKSIFKIGKDSCIFMKEKIKKGTRAEKKVNNSKVDVPLFSIRNKLLVGFIIPIIFMIIIGVAAYQKAAAGMNSKYQESTLQTIIMATDYIDVSETFIEAEGLKYAYDSDLSKYCMGLYNEDLNKKSETQSTVKTSILSSQTANQFISNIHIITPEDQYMISTKSGTSQKGIYNSYVESITQDGNLQKWIDHHEVLDEYVGLSDQDYILSYQQQTQLKNAVIVIDIKESAIEDFISDINLGEGSLVGFVTAGGREVVCENTGDNGVAPLETGENVFYGQDFYQAINTSDNLNGVQKVTYQGDNYLFLYSRSTRDGATVCALVPLHIVTGQADEIKTLAIGLVVLASVVVLVIGLLISQGIQQNMKRIVGKLGEVAQGNLTVEVKVKGRDEFQGLAASATNMIQNNKNLVHKVSSATNQLEVSAEEVKEVSDILSEYSTDITEAIQGINEGMARQSEHAQECVERTDMLSNEMEEVSRVVENVEKLVAETEEMISRGMDIIHDLGQRAEQTTDMTTKVAESITELRKESEIIHDFVKTITDISDQTNLLSLNASIEAARAGEAGRGFAVVAEEIRKLADDSAKAAAEIQVNVEQITAQTVNSVECANQAEAMVELQAGAVEEVIAVFQEMNDSMKVLVEGLHEIIVSTEQADKERSETLAAVKNISEIIEETANSAEVVQQTTLRMQKNVENLNRTAEALGDNMNELKTEISVFKTE